MEAAELLPQRRNLSVTAANVRMLDDTWNANPASVEAALRSRAALPAARHRVAAIAAGLGIELMAVDAPQNGVECVTIAVVPTSRAR